MSNPSVRPMWHVYVRKSTAFVPCVARTRAGFFLDVEPVETVEIDDVDSLARAISAAMTKGNPEVPTPNRGAFPKPVILRPSGVNDWNAFVEGGACFTIFRGAEEIEIAETARNERGEWIDAPSLSQKLPAGSSATDIARRISARAGFRADLTG